MEGCLLDGRNIVYKVVGLCANLWWVNVLPMHTRKSSNFTEINYSLQLNFFVMVIK